MGSIVMAPMAWTMALLQEPLSRRQTVEFVNRMVNNGIDSLFGTPPVDDPWKIWPRAGWCHDYAFTKYCELKLRGISSQLCECIAPDGQHHLVVLVDGLVLDNLTPMLRPMHYKVVRTQSLQNPDLWEAPDDTNV
jgi:predicted transglutaminase-like cysteine proteinase